MNSLVSVIIPCRNEEKYISICLNSIIENDYPKEKLEVLVVDGMSEDRTREIVEKYTKQYSFVRLLENPKKITPAAMNIGIKNSKGEIIIKMDAHSLYTKDYISKCVKHLEESGADNVGGVLKTLPAKNTLFAKAIAISLSHPFGAGTSYFRIGSKKPKWVDTVAFGCYKKEIFKKIGFFNEKMVKIEDFELNSRLRKAGGKILLVPDILAYYYPSSDNFRDFFWHNFTDGIWTTYTLKFGIKIFSFRHLVPLVFVKGFLVSLILGFFFFWARFFFILIFGSYLLTSFFFSLKISFKKGLKYLPILLIVFATRHIGYGLGSIWGLVKILIKK